MKTSKREKVSSPREIRWGFGLLIFFMVGLSLFLTISAGSRFSGVAWGNLMDRNNDESMSQDGFMVVDLSDTIDIEMEQRAEVASMRGAAFAGSLDESKGGKASSKNFRALVPPGEIDAFSALPKVESTDLELPSVSAMASLPLPMLLNEPTGDFGPLPKDLADFESIILNTTEDGMRLPDDSLEELPGMELPDEDIILAEVGAYWKEHVVKSGETLSDIALQYGGVTAQDLLRANSLKDANRLAEQQIILVPNTPEFIEDTLEEVQTRKARVAALREQVQPLKVLSYVVATGDSLWSIANSQNLEVDTLVGSNVFKNSAVLHPGAVLRIPNQDGIFYKFKNGDKIENVAKRYQVAVDKIRKVNPTVDLVSLKAGNEIFLPGARPEAVAEAQVAEKKSGSSSAKNSSGSVQKASRSFRWPVMGKINSPFGWRRHPITRRRDFHTGLDIKAGRGTVIRSSREGQVVYSGWMGGYGKVVVVEHSGGQSTLYAHCSSLLVKQGSKVSVGQNIARVGSTGRTTGPHLHFEVRNGNSPVNPLQYLK
ncbi:MAG: LysM peptidoglycan-binding domain-containing M23 family metallopeptidase [Synergistaceae bacterium]|nr:LysM peptidoglycan-binding domain-containing M23 family metallopeptidase [Synergistaceae bacterium]